MSRLFHEPESNLYIVVMIGFKSKTNPDFVKANLGHSLLKHHRFSSLQVEDEKIKGGLKWVPTKVNLDNHVIVPNLEPKSIDSADKFVEDYVSNLRKTGIKMSKQPMWDLHLLNIKTSDAESVAVLRVHHSLGDGTSLVSLFLSCTRKVSNPEELPSNSIPPTSKEGDSRSYGIKGFWPYLSFKYFWFVFSLFYNTLVDAVMVIATILMFVKDSETPLKGIMGKASGPRRTVHRSLSLDDFKNVKNAMNTTINDAVVAVTQAGLSRNLNRKYGELLLVNKGASERNNNLPKNIRLRAAIMKDLRSSGEVQELADTVKNGYKTKSGNKIGFVIFPFSIALRDDPLDYLREAKARMDRKKASLESEFSYLLSQYTVKFGIKGANCPSKPTLLFSNVKGPQEEISFYGHPIAYVAPSCYGQTNGLTIHVASYANKMTFILSVDDDLIPDPHQLRDDLEESLHLMKNAVIARGLTKSNASDY
ncbi:wax ester synthase/diacylglycerol acyltransferase 4-like [Citrus sinensis]|uniref:wax ester synthase/diacylglycerol acyltransferase 4-like n=1 Tax=Citrus sinensis TaxID=2711 RepID=UPI002278FEC3|nr:wax ester synthase/diacylglycerol acyltransferase 4-like [Citrus sinensis]